jgi:hypothetical protein
METIFIPTENDFRRWIKQAIREYFEENIKKADDEAVPDEPLLSRREIAKKLNNISLVTLNDWVKRGLPRHKQRGKVYFLYSEVLEYIKKNKPGKYIELV